MARHLSTQPSANELERDGTSGMRGTGVFDRGVMGLHMPPVRDFKGQGGGCDQRAVSIQETTCSVRTQRTTDSSTSEGPESNSKGAEIGARRYPTATASQLEECSAGNCNVLVRQAAGPLSDLEH